MRVGLYDGKVSRDINEDLKIDLYKKIVTYYKIIDKYYERKNTYHILKC